MRANAQTTTPGASNAVAATQATKPVPARITQAINEQKLVPMKGNVHPLARPQFDQGIAPGNLPMQRMHMVLQRSPEQQAALNQTMSDLYNAGSPNFHKWLTPEGFGQQFGPMDADIQTVTTWLGAHGFQGIKTAKGKVIIEFSGTAAQVQEAFHTEIHKFVVNGEEHWANTVDPQIPAALTPVVSGIASLNNFPAKPTHRVMPGGMRTFKRAAKDGVTPEITVGGNFDIGPADFATIYNVTPLYTATPTAIDGSGQSIAVIGVSNINVQDVRDFRNLFGLPANDPQVVIDGADPGELQNDSEIEALLDVEYAGGIAKGATIHFVIAADTNTTSGLELAILRVINTNSDPVMNLSFGKCELALGSGGNTLLNGLWEEAAAQGITVTVSAGDNGAAGCEDFTLKPPNVATTGLQVSGFASTPFNVAVGGTDFNDAGTQPNFFNATNDPTTQASAKGYIPETTWNESCTNASFGGNGETNCNAAANASAVQIVGGSGGVSHCIAPTGTTPDTCGTGSTSGYAKPAFQLLSGLTGMPADGHRDIPDVSLFASSGFNKSAYAVCLAGSCPGAFLPVGGTSAAAPAFAGIMALVNQSEVLAGRDGRQGNANNVLYQLAKQQFAAGTACNSVASPLPAAACTFNDVTNGTIAQPCAKNSTDCAPTTGTDTVGVLTGFSTTAGYDLATGLGSVNVKNLVNNWGLGFAALIPTTTTLAIAPTTGITHGQNVTVNITVAPGSGTVKPTGDVSLVSSASSGAFIDGPLALDANGMASNPNEQLTGGAYGVIARYAGDGTFAPSVSAPVAVSVGQEPSITLLSIFADRAGDPFNLLTPGTYPQTAVLRADVSDLATQTAFATGTVKFVDNGVTTLAAGVGISQESAAFTLPPVLLNGGPHSIVAVYSGDPSFNPSVSAPPVVFTVNPAATTTIGSGPANANTGQTVPLTATVQTTTLAPGAAPTGTVTFMNGATTIGSAPVTGIAGSATPASATATLSTSFATAGPQSITAVYNTDGNYAGSTSAAFTVTVASTATLLPTTASINPTTATAGGAGFTLTVNGTNFVNTSVVNFNGVPKVTTFGSATQITAAIAAADIAASGADTVTVTNPAPGGGTSTPALTFTVNGPVPTVTALSATTATVGDPAFTLTVTGSNFVSGSVVNFGAAAKATTFVSSTQVNASILAADLATAGTKAVTVTNPAPGGGTSTPAITFTINNPLPIVASINQTTIAAGSPGFTLTVTGSSFVNGSVVSLAGIAKTTAFVSSTSLTATILTADLATGGAKQVTVTNPAPGGGTSAQTITLNVTNPVPTVTSISPTTAAAGSAAFTLTVTGTNFVSTSVVNFAGAAKATTFVSSTSLTASILAADIAAAGTDAVTVTNPAPGGGTSIQVVNFTVTAATAPTITTINPTTIVAGSATFTLTVNGTNFVNGAAVNFGATAAATTFVNATQLTASIPAALVVTANPTIGVTVTNPAGGGTSNSVNFAVTAAAASYTVAGTAPATIPAGGNATSTITVTPSGGFTGTVGVTCTSTTGAPSAAAVGITCTPNPLNLTIPGTPSGTLTIAVAGNSTTLTASNLPSPQALPSLLAKNLVIVGAGTGFAALFLLFVPGRKRLRTSLGLGLVCLVSLALGCSGVKNNNVGPVATTTTIAVANSKVASGGAGFAFTVTVTGGATPTGMVQLFEGATALGAATAVDATGKAAITILPPSGVGTHVISAHFLGDAGHSTSASGNLNCTVTGTTVLTITGASGGTSKTGILSVTVN